MKVFKLILGFVLFFTLGANTTFAQKATRVEGEQSMEALERRAQVRTDNLAKKVEMTESQVNKIKAIYLKYGKKEREVRSIEDKKERGMKIVEIRKAQEKEIKAVMTKEQRIQYEEQMSKKNEQMASMNNKRKAAKKAEEKGKEVPKSAAKGEPMNAEQQAQKKTDNMVGDLGLNREQIDKVQQVNIDYYKGMEEMLNTMEDRTKMSQKKTELENARLASLKEILTDAQYKKLTEKN
jgi:hypothetical protein